MLDHFYKPESFLLYYYHHDIIVNKNIRRYIIEYYKQLSEISEEDCYSFEIIDIYQFISGGYVT